MSPRFWMFLLSRLGGLLVGLWLPQGAIAMPEDSIGLDFSLPTYQANLPDQPAKRPSVLTSSTHLPVLDFPTETTAGVAVAQPKALNLSPTPQLNQLFDGGTNSLVARAIGSAEGTRSPTGEKTVAYYGHVDPGNGAWNVGSFSYQHGAESPEEADAKQLARLEKQAQELGSQASVKGLELTVEEKLNGLDLANQAPLAALAQDGGGYVDRLQQAREMGLRDAQAILWARTYAYLDPKTNQWNAPGLGNTLDGITQDQQRRLQAVARAIDVDRPTSLQAPSETTGKTTHETSEPPKTIVEPKTQPIKQEQSPPPAKQVELDFQPGAFQSAQAIQDQVTEQIIFQDLPN